MLTEREIETGMSLGEVIAEALDDMPAEWYELVWVKGQGGNPQALIWPMQLNSIRQGNFVRRPGDPVQAYSHRIDH